MINLKAKPFNLNGEQIEWVKNTLAHMTEDEKIGQILCPQLSSLDDNSIEYYTKTLKVGAGMIRPYDLNGLQESINKLQNSSEIPLLVAANLENGGSGAIAQGTFFANPMGCAATGDKINGYRLGKISCAEASSVGVNWAFAPIIDIDENYHNPITNVRTFGSNPQTVLDFAREYIKAAKEEGVLPTIKHFPGDGRDERDQHLLVSVNDCSFEEWLATYGKVYKTLIDEGAPAVMAGHIAAPFVAKGIDGNIGEADALLPASQSKILIDRLLRHKLGFNGLVITDSTLMVGYMQNMPRRKALPYSVECGVDMILFNRSVEEDFKYLKEGVKSGILSGQRLDEAVLRVLALKASLKLNVDSETHKNYAEIVGNSTFKKWTEECAESSVTLVKDTEKLLPLSPKRTKRIYLNVIENVADNNSAFAKDVKKRFESEGFKVTLRRRKYPFDPASLTLEKITPAVNKALAEVMCNTENFVSKYDMAIIVLDMKTASNATVVRVNWSVLFGMGNDLPWYSGEMPLLVISMNNPYHLLDIPMAHAYVNAYTDNKETLDSVFEKIMGRSDFKGISPVDAFCGKEDAKL